MIKNKKVVGIICEFNPFHDGHRYLIDNIKKDYKNCYIVCVMSGDFVQRGECAIVDKYHRTKSALNYNVDLVIELPVEFAVASAKDFARSAVNILNELKYVDVLAFSSEHGDEVVKIQKKLKNENSKQSKQIQDKLKNGATYPKAIAETFNINILPNDILAIEYINALEEIKSKIKIKIYQRNLKIASAHSIREKIRQICDNNKLNENEQEIFDIINKYPISDINDFSEYLNYKLILDKNEGNKITEYYDIKEDLANAISKSIFENYSFTERCEKLKTKNLTYAYISRALLRIIIGIKKDEVEYLKKHKYFSHIRVLGFNKTSEELISRIPKKYLLMSASPKNVDTLKNKKSIELNIFASNLYNMVLGNNQNEICRKIIVNML